MDDLSWRLVGRCNRKTRGTLEKKLRWLAKVNAGEKKTNSQGKLGEGWLTSGPDQELCGTWK